MSRPSTPTCSSETAEALRRARSAWAEAQPQTLGEHLAKALAFSDWLGDNAEDLGVAGLDDLAHRLEPLRKHTERRGK